MLLVKIKNKSQRTMMVPLATIIERAVDVVEKAEPNEDASCVFFPPQSSQQVQDAVLLWAAQSNIEVDISFSVPRI